MSARRCSGGPVAAGQPAVLPGGPWVDLSTTLDPTTVYADRARDEQYLAGAGTDAEPAENVPADHGEQTYRGPAEDVVDP